MASSKAIAMRRFQRNRMLHNILNFFQVCAAFFLFSRSSFFPIVLEAFWHSYALFNILFNHPFYIFLFLNALILSILALSTNNDFGSTDVYDEFLNSSDAGFNMLNNPREFTPEKQSPKGNSSEKLKICSEVPESPVFHKTVTAVTKTTKTTTTTMTCCTTVSSGGDKGSDKKSYRRVQSERRVVVAPQRKLRRSNTGCAEELQGLSCYVEHLSTDEFNRTVEDFIARQKRMLFEEQRQLQKTEYLALTS